MFKKQSVGRHRRSKGAQQAPTTSRFPAPTPVVARSTASPVSPRSEARAQDAFAIVTVLESRLQSPFG
jgi:hypothetical protein